MRPLLDYLSDGELRGTGETVEAMASSFGLTEAELNELLPSGRQTVFKNRIAWAKSYLKQAALVEAPARGKYRITPRGTQALETGDPVNMKFLERYQEYQDFRNRTRQGNDDSETSSGDERTPEELVELGYNRINDELAAELVGRIKACPPDFFERLVVELLLAMGYGGSRKDAGEAVGRGGDGGIDGIIKEDRLGLDAIYIQAKRWEGTVGRPEIQKFAGALQGRRARRGVFITTSEYSKEARDFAASIDAKIVLLDGGDLANLMIDFNVGVSPKSTYEIKEIDGDYFETE
jgi:restriction system protein